MFKSKSPQKDIVDHLTDPAKHGTDFIYLVHGLNPETADHPLKLEERIASLHDPSYHYCASLVGQMSPEAVVRDFYGGFRGARDERIQQLITFTPTGFILAPQPLDIRVAWNSEVGSPVEQDALQEWVSKHDGKVLSPYKLLAKTVGPYNQLVLAGNPATQIQGIFYQHGTPEPVLAGVVSRTKLALGGESVPIIELRPDVTKPSETLLFEKMRATTDFSYYQPPKRGFFE